MTIASAIISTRNKISNVYTAIANKGGTLPIIQNLNNLPATVDSMSTNYFTVTVIDYDGTILKKEKLASGTTFTLPSIPSHTGLTFQEWSSSVTITNNTVTVDNDIMIGAVYTTTSGLFEVDITLNQSTGLTVALRMDGTKDWGDGTSDTETTHTYSQNGDYTITCNGTTMTPTSHNYGLFDQGYSSSTNYYVRRIRFSNNIKDFTAWSMFAGCRSLESITLSKCLTRIAYLTFAGSYNLKTIIIPSSVTLIDSRAFESCYNINTVIIPNSVTLINSTAFESCYNINTVIIPNSVTYLGQSAFSQCYSLENMIIPSSLKKIASSAFSGCRSLKTVIFYGDELELYSNIFSGCYSLKTVIFPSNVKGDFTYVFQACYSLKNVTIPGNVDNFGSFYNCYAIENIIIPDTVTKINAYAFYNCYSLKNITIPGNVKEIGTYAFYSCQSIKNIVIPGNVTKINDYAFCHCQYLTNVIFLDNAKKIGNYMFYNCTSLTDVTLPNSITTIGNDAFYNCTSLASITLPNSITTIRDQTFYNCTSLANITLPNSITNIGVGAFSSCTSLTSVTIPNNITTIDGYAFADCISVLEYDFSACTAVPTLTNNDVFYNINQNCKILVPWDLYNNWKKATNWIVYADYIDGGTPANINFTVNPNGCAIYVDGQLIQGNSTSWVGPTLNYVINDLTNNVVLSNTQTGITEGANINISADLTTSNKITLITELTDLEVKFTINGVTFNATDEGNGDYSINVVGSGKQVSYVIKGEGYATVRGTITTTGLDITIPITMEPATEEPWTRPNLTSNGQIGGDSFAVCCTNPEFNEYAWMAVDDVTQDGYHTEWYAYMERQPEYIFYNLDPIKVSELKFVFGYRMAEEIKVYASEDGTTWESLDIAYNPVPEYDETIGLQYTTCTLTNDDFYSYYKIVFIGYDVVTITDLEITAMQLI